MKQNETIVSKNETLFQKIPPFRNAALLLRCSDFSEKKSPVFHLENFATFVSFVFLKERKKPGFSKSIFGFRFWTFINVQF